MDSEKNKTNAVFYRRLHLVTVDFRRLCWRKGKCEAVI